MFDPVGKTFHFLTCLSEAERKIFPGADGRKGTVRRRIVCQCICGVVKEYDLPPVWRGATKSCGCQKAALCSQPLTHGMSHTKEWNAWKDMHRRCKDKTLKNYHRYGGRGIKVCKRWSGPGGFERFLLDIGPCPDPKLTIDRINNDGNYAPTNCRWATRTVQTQNSTKVRILTWQGKSLCVSEWAQLTGIKPTTIISRLDRGWSIDRALAGSPPERRSLP